MNVDLKMENVAFSMPKTKRFWQVSSDPLFKIIDFWCWSVHIIIIFILLVTTLTFSSCLCPRRST